jgi:hypothetical protein
MRWILLIAILHLYWSFFLPLIRCGEFSFFLLLVIPSARIAFSLNLFSMTRSTATWWTLPASRIFYSLKLLSFGFSFLAKTLKRTEPKMGFTRKASIIFAAAATKTPN